MKFQCSAESTCTLVANYKNPTGDIVCRKHVESMETAVHIDWKKCRDCNSLKWGKPSFPPKPPSFKHVKSLVL